MSCREWACPIFSAPFEAAVGCANARGRELFIPETQPERPLPQQVCYLLLTHHWHVQAWKTWICGGDWPGIFQVGTTNTLLPHHHQPQIATSYSLGLWPFTLSKQSPTFTVSTFESVVDCCKYIKYNIELFQRNDKQDQWDRFVCLSVRLERFRIQTYCEHSLQILSKYCMYLSCDYRRPWPFEKRMHQRQRWLVELCLHHNTCRVVATWWCKCVQQNTHHIYIYIILYIYIVTSIFYILKTICF